MSKSSASEDLFPGMYDDAEEQFDIIEVEKDDDALEEDEA